MTIIVFSKRIACAVGVALLACGAPTSHQAPVTSSAERTENRLGDFTLKDVDNNTHSLSDYLGSHVVAISFFATWCEPCKKELVHLDRIYRAQREKGLIVLAVSMDEPETQGEVRPLVKQRNFAFPVLLDTEGTASDLFNPRRDAPYNLIIDRGQSVVWSKAGYTPGDEKRLEDAVLTAISTAGSP